MNCNNCNIDIDRKVFCCDKCRNQYFRKQRIVATIIKPPKRQTDPKRVDYFKSLINKSKGK